MNTQNVMSTARRIFDLDAPTPEQKAEAEGYDRESMPLGGALKVLPQHCTIETDRECGCAFGQCAKGLIF